MLTSNVAIHAVILLSTRRQLQADLLVSASPAALESLGGRLGQNCPMDDDHRWDRLIESLDEWTAASEVAPGRIEVVLAGPGPERRVVIAMTPDE